jgi:hypothetical protein
MLRKELENSMIDEEERQLADLISRSVFDAQEMVDKFPAQIHDGNKEIVYRIACPPRCKHNGDITVSRWRSMPLPENISDSERSTRLDEINDVFQYERIDPKSAEVHWHINFAYSHLFTAYGSDLFAQDEMQVAEHLALASLVEALPSHNIKPLTVENDEPTPILILGVECRIAISTESNSEENYPNGL